MTAKQLDGKQVSLSLLSQIKEQVQQLKTAAHIFPTLAVILVGEDPASALYVQKKCDACETAGIDSKRITLPSNISENDLLSLISELNQDEDINGILVQLPLPSHISTHKVATSIDPNKDVDGFHPMNMGQLAIRTPNLRPCTPYGIIQLLNAYNIELDGKHVVIIGASNIVGRPLALEFLLKKCTVTVCHRYTKALKPHVASADILVSATGKTGIIDPEWIKSGAVVIDVGINRDNNGKLVGDLDHAHIAKKASWITPVPGGVGPMTVAMLLNNTLVAACHLQRNKT